MSSSKKKGVVKILLVGSIQNNNNYSTLIKKLRSLQSSKAGPFDICFCVGPVDDNIIINIDEKEEDFEFPPLPVYFQEYSTTTTTTTTNSEETKNDGEDEDENKNKDKKRLGAGIISLGSKKKNSSNKNTNLFTFDLVNYNNKNNDDDGHNPIPIFDIPIPSTAATSTTSDTTLSLKVAVCPRNVRSSFNNKNKNNKTHQQQNQPSSCCDLLLSHDWPQGMEETLQVETEPLSYDVAEIALLVKPRYHISPSTQYYHTSPPYEMPRSQHVCRFIALAPVSTTKPTKTTKFIHALGLQPLSDNPPPTTAPSTLPCPFLTTTTTTGNSNINNKNTDSTTTTTTRRLPPAFAMQSVVGGSSGGYSRFASNKRSRTSNDNDNNNNSLQPPDDPSIKTLFLYGLHKDVSGELQSTSSSKVLLAFSKYSIEKVRHPPNATTSTYCFLEFPNQDIALRCLLDCHGRFNIDGIDLTLKWATTQQDNKRQRTTTTTSQHQQHYVTHDQAQDSCTIYFHPPKGVEFNEEFATTVQSYLQKTLEDALNDGNQDDNDEGEGSNKVTAETEPALKVQVRTKDTYGFLEFASHAAATMALASVTNSTDGGLIVQNKQTKEGDDDDDDGSKNQNDEENKNKKKDVIVGTTLRWAKGEIKKSKREEVLEALGLQRQYYPADSRTDCWFCLASPTCETHLIVGVYSEWYMTLPKGSVHPGHVLLVPVEHASEGSWTFSQSSIDEWTGLVTKLQRHALEQYDMDLFVFERAMATKGNYHTHIQCVPIPKHCTNQLRSTMMAHSKASGFDLKHIQSDLGTESLLVSGGDDSSSSSSKSYFYAEIITGSQKHRFLYKQNAEGGDDGGENSSSLIVPLQFAREVLASVLKEPKLAHWKSCVVDKEEETKMANEFRTSFASI